MSKTNKCNHLQVLTAPELKAMSKYVHSASKTTIELWMIKNISEPIERNLIPDCFTPNVVTLMGNIPLPFVIYKLLTKVGTTVTDSEPVQPQYLVFAGLALLWFS